ncbi:putative SOS response-associated peptidase YedK [compost metagenome]
MCRRFSLSAELDEVREHFGVQRVMYYYKTRYNMSPTQQVPIVLEQDGERVLDEFRWGIIPYWGKDCVNAELSTVRVNPTYRKMIETRRCIIPCNGFYYWRNEGKRSCAVRVVLPGQAMFAVAGLYEVWKDTRKEPLRTCTMLTTVANTAIREFDSRMPAILTAEQAERWLDPNIQEMDRLMPLLQTYEETDMQIYPVTPLVGDDQHDTRQCIQEMDLKLAWFKP